MEQLEPVRFRVSQVYEALRDAICEGRLLPGERMAEDVLANRLNVSRQPVHQALQQLRQEGFVAETGRRGLVVAPVNVEVAQHIYDLRAALDAAAAGGAARRATGHERREGEALLLAGRRAVEQRDIHAMIHADFQFHHYIHVLSGNPLVENVATMNWHHVRRVVSALAAQLVGLKAMWEEHDLILSAVVDGDADAAERLARLHAQATMSQIRSIAGDAPAELQQD